MGKRQVYIVHHVRSLDVGWHQTRETDPRRIEFLKVADNLNDSDSGRNNARFALFPWIRRAYPAMSNQKEFSISSPMCMPKMVS